MKNHHRLQSPDVCWGFAVLLLVVLQFWWLPGEQGASTDSYSASIDGKLGLYRTLSELFPVVSRDPLRLIPDQPATLILVAPDRYPTSQEAGRIARFVSEGGTLLFAPNWTAEACDLPELGIHVSPIGLIGSMSTGNSSSSIPAPPPSDDSTDTVTTPDSVPAESESSSNEQRQQMAGDGSVEDQNQSEGRLEIPDGEAQLRPQSGPTSEMQALDRDRIRDRSVVVSTQSRLSKETVEWRKSASLRPPGNRPQTEVLVQSDDATPEVIAWRIGRGKVVACSSPDLFSNRSLLDRPRRRLAVRLVEYCHQSDGNAASPDKPLVICEYLTASSAYRHAGILLSPALRMGTLQLMLLAVLSGWLGFHRFGPPRVTHTEKRRNLSESAIAVGNLQFRLHDGGKVVSQYMEFLNTDLRRKYGGAVQLENIEELCRRSGLSEEEIVEQLRTAERQRSSKGVAPAAAARTIRWLSRLRQRLSGSEKQHLQSDSDSEEDAS